MMIEKLLVDKQLLKKQLFWIQISFDECLKIGIKQKYSIDEFGKFETLCSRYSRGIDFLIRKIFRTLDEYEFEIDLKYGRPVIKNVVKKKNNRVKLLLRSQKYDKGKNYFYYKNHTVKEKKDISKNPDIKFEIINNKLVFREIN